MFNMSFNITIIICIILCLLGMSTFPYIINTWTGFFGHEPVCKWWQGAILGCIPYVNTLMIPGVIITWVVSWFVDDNYVPKLEECI